MPSDVRCVKYGVSSTPKMNYRHHGALAISLPSGVKKPFQGFTPILRMMTHCWMIERMLFHVQ